MYAVVVSGGKQYRVEVGTTLKVEKRDIEPNAELTLDVLMIGENGQIEVGTPRLAGSVSAKVLSHGRHPKVRIIKFKRRKHHMKQMGHRQDFTEIEITAIHRGKKEG